MASIPHPTRFLEICRVLTRDDLKLDGAFHLPYSTVSNPLPVDAVLLIHGTGSNFYAEGVLEAFASSANRASIPVLRANTRGHDAVASIPKEEGGSARGGAAYEVIDECRHDITAWLSFLAGRGLARIALVGHSMGAVKAIYSQACERRPNVVAVIAISPPRFCHENFLKHPRGEPFRDDFARATRLVADGRGEELIDVRQPLPLLLTAAGFLAKYGTHDDYDVIKHLPKLTVPTLVMVGDESAATSPAFDGLPEALSQIASKQASMKFELVRGADTNYRACLDTPFTIATKWLTSEPLCRA